MVEKPEEDANVAQTRRLSEIACHAQGQHAISADPMKVVEGGRFCQFSSTGNDDDGLYGPGVVEKPEEVVNIARTRRLSEIACHST